MNRMYIVIKRIATDPFFPFLIIPFLIISVMFSPAFSAENHSGRIVDIKGEVQVMQDGAHWETASSGRLLMEGDTLKTGQAGWAAILMADETLVQISRNSVFVIKTVAKRAGWFGSGKNETGPSNSSEYQLDSGRAWMRNKNRNVPIDIETPSVTAAIRGTELNIEVPQDMSTKITVLSGRVGCRNEAGTVVAGKNDVVDVRQGMAPSRQTLLSPEDSVQWTVTVPVMMLKTGIPVTEKTASMSYDENEKPDDMLGKALFQLEIRENEKARIILEKLTNKFPDYPMGWSALSLVSLYMGKKDAALKYSEKATDLKPESPAPYIIKSYTHQALFDLDSAIKSTEMAIEIDPSNTLALVNLAKLKFGSDYTEEALEIIRKAESSAPSDSRVLSTKGFILTALRKTDEAAESFRKAIKADSSSGDAWLGYSIIMMRQGQTETALEYISAAITLEPRRAMFVSYWGKMLHEIKRFDRALEVLELASELDPNDPTPHLYRAIILNDLNRPTEAVKAVNRSIELNDNRAVYNSRFILDRDLAVKSVGLAYLYNRLGLTEWGTNKALMSMKQDYTNFAAHMFYGDGFLHDGDKSRLYISEQVIAKLLQPATVNTFNSFNNYTSLFEKPNLYTTLTGTHGSNDTNHGSAQISGVIPEINSAFTLFSQKMTSDGWRDENKTELNGISGQFKADTSINDNIWFSGGIGNNKYIDQLTNNSKYEYSYLPDPENRSKDTFSIGEAGYHRHLGPGKDLLLYFKKASDKNKLWYHEGYEAFEFPNSYPPPDILHATFDKYELIKWEKPDNHLQGQYHFPSGNHQITIGGLRYWDDISLESNYKEIYYFIEDNEFYTDVDTTRHNDVQNTFTSGYIKDIWTIKNNVIIDTAIYYDVMDYVSPYVNVATDRRELNPRFGIIWQPAASHTFRASVFRYLLPFYAKRIDSTEVAGFPIFRNSSEGDLTVEGDMAYEYDWETGIAGIDAFYLDKENKYKWKYSDGINVNKTLSGYSKGLMVFINQLINNGIGFRTKYSYKDVSNDYYDNPKDNMRDHQLTTSITGVHRNGVTATLAQTFRYIDRIGSGLTDEDIWLTDASIGMDFKDKKGGISFDILNIFNNHFDWTQEQSYTAGGRVPATQYILTTTLNF